MLDHEMRLKSIAEKMYKAQIEGQHGLCNVLRPQLEAAALDYGRAAYAAAKTLQDLEADARLLKSRQEISERTIEDEANRQLQLLQEQALEDDLDAANGTIDIDPEK